MTPPLGLYDFHWPVIWEDGNLGYLLGGLWITIALTVTSFAASLPLGLAIAGARNSKFAPLKTFGYVYVELLRTVPLLLGLLWVYYALPQLIPGFRMSPFFAAWLFFTMNLSAFVAEAFRAGILSVDAGQRKAALALGMRKHQVLKRVVLPQAVRRVVPVLGNIWVALFKDTSLVYVIAVSEVTYRSTRLSFDTYRHLEIYTLTMIVYFLLTWPQARLVDRFYEGVRTRD